MADGLLYYNTALGQFTSTPPNNNSGGGGCGGGGNQAVNILLAPALANLTTNGCMGGGSGGGTITMPDALNLKSLTLSKGLSPTPMAANACKIGYQVAGDPQFNDRLDIVGYGVLQTDKRKIYMWDDVRVMGELLASKLDTNEANVDGNIDCSGTVTANTAMHTKLCTVDNDLIVGGKLTVNGVVFDPSASGSSGSGSGTSSSSSVKATLCLRWGYVDVAPFDGRNVYCGVAGGLPGNPSSTNWDMPGVASNQSFQASVIGLSSNMVTSFNVIPAPPPVLRPGQRAFPARYLDGPDGTLSFLQNMGAEDTYTQFRILFFGTMIPGEQWGSAVNKPEEQIVQSVTEFDVVSYDAHTATTRTLPNSAFCHCEAGWSKGYKLIASPWLSYAQTVIADDPLTLYVRFRGNSAIGYGWVPPSFLPPDGNVIVTSSMKFRFGPMYMQVR